MRSLDDIDERLKRNHDRWREHRRRKTAAYHARPRGRIGKMLWIEVWFMPGGGVGV